MLVMFYRLQYQKGLYLTTGEINMYFLDNFSAIQILICDLVGTSFDCLTIRLSFNSLTDEPVMKRDFHRPLMVRIPFVCQVCGTGLT